MGAGLSAEERETVAQTQLTATDAKIIVKSFKKYKKESLDKFDFQKLVNEIKPRLSTNALQGKLFAREIDELFRLFDTNHDSTGTILLCSP
jgi:Ca2+-binding EF-hand superfamily protein